MVPDPTPTPRPSAATRLWRSLPLTAQLLALGMAVGLAWFVVSRSAAVRQQEAASARNAALFEVQRTEVMASQLGTALAELSRAHRGYVLSGDASFLADHAAALDRYGQRHRMMLEHAGSDHARLDTEVIDSLVRAWHDAAYLPNVARRAAGGLAAFAPGTEGDRAVRRGAALMDSALARQEHLTRELRDEAQAVQALVEEASTRDDLATFLIWSAALVVVLLLLVLLMRLVAGALAQVIAAAEALAGGRYAEATLPDAATAPNREMASLSSSFAVLAASMQQRERQLQDDIVKLRELERLKRDFVSTVSHELRTPLTSMRGALGLILGGKVGEVPAKGRDLLQIAMTNTERLIRLINDILDVEKMDAGQVNLRRDPLRLRTLLDATLAGLEAFGRDHGVNLRIASGAADATLIGDADRLIQVFTNLVSNAVKFSPAGAEVEVAIVPEGEQVRVCVRDHGPGIAPEFAARIFGRFQQAADADSRRRSGTGLGLNIARGIVEMHAGRIGFDPADGGGTVFWVTLPCTATVAEPAPGEPRSAPTRDPRRAVLVVEDDASMRDVLLALVQPLARPLAAASAEEAFAILRREPVAAVVLDPGLPGMDGFAFARELRKDPALRTMPVFLFSAREYAPEELRAAGIRAADAYVKTRDAESVIFERLRKELTKVS